MPGSDSPISPTARQLLEAARRIVERRGYKGLTYTAIGEEAGLSANLVSYHFGSKAGLLVALLDWLMYDTLWEVSQHLSRLREDEDRVSVFMEDPRGLLANTGAYRLFYDLLPHVLDDPKTRSQLGRLLHQYTESNISAILGDRDAAVAPEVRALAVLQVAMTDGLAIQLLANSEDVDIDLALSLWEGYVRWVLDGLRARS
jgi:AcrR family transcriptional regulator